MNGKDIREAEEGVRKIGREGEGVIKVRGTVGGLRKDLRAGSGGPRKIFRGRDSRKLRKGMVGSNRDSVTEGDGRGIKKI